MNVLIACEESQTVCKAFRARGFDAYSCDIQECSGGHPEWHIHGDVLPILNGGDFTAQDGGSGHVDKWDMIIAHPPCTFLSNCGAVHLFRGHQINMDRYNRGMEGRSFFMKFYEYGALGGTIAIENPVPSSIFNLPKETQIIEPYDYGEPVSKKTLLWLFGVPLLYPTNIVKSTQSCHDSGTWFSVGGKERQKNRSKTFDGIAQAMAEQWGDYIRDGKTQTPVQVSLFE